MRWRASSPRTAASVRFPAADAFTLVELLVVISIIAVLLGLLMPAAVKTRDLARRTACASNLRQICVALQCYRTRWDAYPPDGGTNVISRPSGKVGLGHLVPSDAGDMGVFFCPAASEITRAKYGVTDDQIGLVSARCSYWYSGGGAMDYNGPDNVNHRGRVLIEVMSDGSIRQIRADDMVIFGVKSD